MLLHFACVPRFKLRHSDIASLQHFTILRSRIKYISMDVFLRYDTVAAAVVLIQMHRPEYWMSDRGKGEWLTGWCARAVCPLPQLDVVVEEDMVVVLRLEVLLFEL